MRTPSWESSPGALDALLSSAFLKGPAQWVDVSNAGSDGNSATVATWLTSSNQPAHWQGTNYEMANTALVMADLYTITLLNGTVLRFTSGSFGVTINGNAFVAGPLLQRQRVKIALGAQADAMGVTLNDSAETPTTIGGVPIIQFISKGGLTNARVVLERLFCSIDNVPVGTLVIFSGRVGAVDGGRHVKTVQVLSDLELLNVMVPRDVFQAGCKNTLFDQWCTLSRAAYTSTSTASGPTDVTQTTFAIALTQADGYFDLGVVTMTSGANAGISRTVKHNVHAASLTVVNPWPYPVVTGDAFSIVPGCDKTQATCTSKFSNVIHFRGEPYIPAPDTVT